MSTCIDVHSQKELDAALAKGNACIHLKGDGVYAVAATGNSQVRAYGNSQVRAYGNSQVRATGNSQVRAYGNSQVRATGNSQVRAYGNSQVRAYGNSQVRAYDNSQVRAYDNSQVRAYDNSQVRATGNSQVRATPYVAVTTSGTRVKVTGGHVIATPLLDTAEKWCEFYGVEVKDGIAVLFKAVNDRYESTWHSFSYQPGTVPEAPDWDPIPECGGGLHFSPRPVMALTFNREATKYVACPVRVSEIIVHPTGQYPEKVKAPRACEPVWECDIDGDRLVTTETAS